MHNFFNIIFNAVGRQYEVLVYDRARITAIAEKRDDLKLGRVNDDRVERLARKIQLTESILAALAELKDLSND